MRKVLISLAAAGAALVVAAPASAQYYGGQPSGYASNGYGYNGARYGNFGQVRALQGRLDALEYRIRMLDRRDVIRDDRADRLRADAQRLEGRLHRAARNGLSPNEANEIQGRLAELEQRVQYATAYRGGRDRYDRGDRDDRGDHDGRWDRR
jgi:hypothetical protein